MMKKKTAPSNPEPVNPEDKKAVAKKELKKELKMELMEALPDSKLAKRKKIKRKKQLKWVIYLCVFALLSYGVYLLFKPYKSGMAFGICKVFIELQSTYPSTIYFSYVDHLGSSVRVWYTRVDPYGQYRLEVVRCYFRPPTGNSPYELDRVTFGKRELDPDIIEKFNVSIPTIVANPPDLTYPTPLPDSLNGLHFDFDKYRKPIF